MASTFDGAVKQLAQVRPAGTGAVSAIKKASKSKLLLTSVIITNTTGSAAAYSLYLDNNGTTYDQTTAIAYAVSLAANTTAIMEFIDGLPIDKAATNGNFAVQTGTGNALTFTINGLEF